MRFLICSICFLVFSPYLTAREIIFKGFKINPDSTILSEENLHGYTIPDTILDKLPFKNQNNLNRIYPGVVSYFQDFYIRGGESYETGFFIDGTKINDLFTGKNSFFLNPNTIEKIEFYNGFIPNDFGNVSSGLFNYKLRTGGAKINFEVEHLNDNITFTNNPYSGNKSLGAYYYGHNETNINVGGPLFFPNVRFFANVNYLFQKDKNPQRYPGADNVTFIDDDSYNPDSITINLPAGIVPLNSFESFNFLSTLFFDFESIQIKASGIYFDENSFVERNHIDEYLNTRAGLVDKNGGIINVNIHHKLNEALSYSLSGNYSVKNEVTSDQYLGDDYWSYGDSVANANAGVIWQRSEQDINYGLTGRYTLPTQKFILINRFYPAGYPIIDHQKSFQKSVTLSGSVYYNLKNHNIRISGDYTQNTIGLWQLPGQARLAGDLYSASLVPPFINYTENELKEFVVTNRGVNNIGYDLLGKKNESAPQPINYSFYIDDSFDAFNNFQLYVGLRYDYFDYDFKKMIDPAAPEKTIDYWTGELISSGLIDIESQSFVSPKAAIKFQAIKNLAFTASYSQNVQSHPYSNIYEGIYSLGHKLRAGNYILSNVEDSKPIVNKSIELGTEYKPFSNLSLKLNYFNKNSNNLMRNEFQNTNSGSPYGSYYYSSNNGKMDVNGIEFLLDYFYKGFYLRSHFSFQSAKEELLLPLTYNGASGWPVLLVLEPDQINKFSFNLLMYYDFSSLINHAIFKNLNISVLCNSNSGHPFLKYFSSGSDNTVVVNSVTPSISQIDLKIEKGFCISDVLSFDVYFYALNLFDRQNIYDVFSNTGKPDDDGYLDYFNPSQHSEEAWAKMIQLHQLELAYNPSWRTADILRTTKTNWLWN